MSLTRVGLWLTLAAWLAAGLLAACAPAATATLAPVLAASPPVTASPSRPAATPAALIPPDLVITAGPPDQTVTMQVGQILALRPPDPASEWQVTYSNKLFEALTPPDQMRRPGAAGWLFRAIAAGQMDLGLTSIAAPCPSGSPCPPNVRRFTWSIVIH